jgi:hypothetical protein
MHLSHILADFSNWKLIRLVLPPGGQSGDFAVENGKNPMLNTPVVQS